jgi:hypothetical protein
MNLKKCTKATVIYLANTLAENNQVMKFTDLNNLLERFGLYKYKSHRGLTVMISGAFKTESRAGRLNSANNLKYAFVKDNYKYAWRGK